MLLCHFYIFFFHPVHISIVVGSVCQSVRSLDVCVPRMCPPPPPFYLLAHTSACQRICKIGRQSLRWRRRRRQSSSVWTKERSGALGRKIVYYCSILLYRKSKWGEKETVSPNDERSHAQRVRMAYCSSLYTRTEVYGTWLAVGSNLSIGKTRQITWRVFSYIGSGAELCAADFYYFECSSIVLGLSISWYSVPGVIYFRGATTTYFNDTIISLRDRSFIYIDDTIS